jgi:hypothetical protein
LAQRLRDLRARGTRLNETRKRLISITSPAADIASKLNFEVHRRFERNEDKPEHKQHNKAVDIIWLNYTSTLHDSSIA